MERDCRHPKSEWEFVGQRELDGQVRVSLLCLACGSLTNPAVFPPGKVWVAEQE